MRTTSAKTNSWVFAVMPLPRRRGDIREHPIDGEAVLFDSRTGETYLLTETALDVWARCDGRHTALDLARHHVSRYAVELDTAIDQVEQVVAFFAEAGLLHLEEHDSLLV